MKLADTTLETLKNFAQINPKFLLKEGKVQKIIADDKSIMGEAILEEEVPVEAGIYNLPEFLGLLNMLDNPNIDFIDSGRALLDDGEVKLNYRFAPANLIAAPPEDVLEIEEPDAKVVLLEKQLQKMLKLASALGLPNLYIVGNKKGISLKINDQENDSSHDGTIVLSTEPSSEFTAIWQTQHLQIVPGNYNVVISLGGISIWENENQTRKYYIPLQS